MLCYNGGYLGSGAETCSKQQATHKDDSEKETFEVRPERGEEVG